jgi:hypothetical protein
MILSKSALAETNRYYCNIQWGTAFRVDTSSCIHLCIAEGHESKEIHGIHRDTWGYTGIHGDTLDTWGYTGIHGDTRGYIGYMGYTGIHGDI